MPPSALSAELNAPSGSDFGRYRHGVLPPFLAPAGVERGLRRLFTRSAFDGNIMLITRFPKDPADPITKTIEAVHKGVLDHGMQLHLASDAMSQDTLWDNVVTYMWGCRYGIVLVDAAGGTLNPNVLIEVGGMLMTGRRCAILRDDQAPAMPTDLVGHIYRSVSFSDAFAVEQAVHSWLARDLGLGSCERCTAS